MDFGCGKKSFAPQAISTDLKKLSWQKIMFPPVFFSYDEKQTLRDTYSSVYSTNINVRIYFFTFSKKMQSNKYNFGNVRNHTKGIRSFLLLMNAING